MGDPTQTPRKSEIIRKSQDVATLASSHPLSLEYLRTDPRHRVMTLKIYGSASGEEWKGLLDVTSTHMSTTMFLSQATPFHRRLGYACLPSGHKLGMCQPAYRCLSFNALSQGFKLWVGVINCGERDSL